MNITTVKYTPNNNGFVVNDNLFVPTNPTNKDYQKILKWIDEGNTPEPAYTETKLKQKHLHKRIISLETSLIQENHVLLKMLFVMYKVGETNGLWNKADFEAKLPEIIDKIQDLKTKLDELENLQTTGD
jgi:hypothetical protein